MSLRSGPGGGRCNRPAVTRKNFLIMCVVTRRGARAKIKSFAEDLLPKSCLGTRGSVHETHSVGKFTTNVGMCALVCRV